MNERLPRLIRAKKVGPRGAISYALKALPKARILTGAQLRALDSLNEMLESQMEPDRYEVASAIEDLLDITIPASTSSTVRTPCTTS